MTVPDGQPVLGPQPLRGREGGPGDARADPADVVLDLALASNAGLQPEAPSPAHGPVPAA